jgi:VanZ family protein
MTIKFMTKFCGAALVVLFVIIALGPGKWAPRTGFGFQVDHFLGYLALTSLVCLAWPRPVIVGGALMAGGALLEGLQVFTPNHHADLVAASCGAEGALVAALLAELFIRVQRWTIRKRSEAGAFIVDRPSATGWVPS